MEIIDKASGKFSEAYLNSDPGADRHGFLSPPADPQDGDAEIVIAWLEDKAACWIRYGQNGMPWSWGEVAYADTPDAGDRAKASQPVRLIAGGKLYTWPDDRRMVLQDRAAPKTVQELFRSVAGQAFSDCSAGGMLPLPDGASAWGYGRQDLVFRIEFGKLPHEYLIIQWSDDPAASDGCDACISYWIFEADKQTEKDGGEMDYDSKTAGYMTLADALDDIVGFAYDQSAYDAVTDILPEKDLHPEDFGL